MARNKQHMIKSAQDALKQAQSIMADPNVTYNEVRSAASQASQAANELFQLAGMMDVDADKEH